MVTPNETPVSSEVDSSPEVTESIPVDDAPLIPADFDDRYDQPAATEEETPSGDETTSDDNESQPEESSESSESITAETEQTPEVAIEETPAEGEEPEARTYTQEERNNQEAAYRKQFAEQQKQVTDMQAQMAKMQDDYQNNLVDAEVRAYTSALQTQYVDEGMDESQASARAQRELAAAKQDWLNTQENQQLKQQIAATEAQSASIAQKASVDHLMQEHGVPESQRVLLNGYTDPALAVEAAKALGAAEALKTETRTAKLAEVPNGTESGSYDSTAGSVGTETEAQWLDKYNAGTYDSPADDAKAIKILKGRGIDMPFR